MIEQKKDCSNCLNRCMDMDMDPYCYSEGWILFVFRASATKWTMRENPESWFYKLRANSMYGKMARPQP